jgi:NADH-quinone oxidoreductase subunit G
VRWPETEAGQAWGPGGWDLAPVSVPDAAPTPNGRLRLGRFRTLWASKEVEASPALHFMRARQVVELAPADADALGIREGDRVEVGMNGTRLQGPVRLRAATPAGTVFLSEGTAEQPANALTEPLVEVRRVGVEPLEARGVPAQAQPAAEGLAEMPQSAPMDIPPTTGGGGTIGGGR